VFLAAGSYLSISAMGYLVIVYFVSYATRNLQFSLPVTLGLLQSAAVIFAISIRFFANRSDIILAVQGMYIGPQDWVADHA